MDETIEMMRAALIEACATMLWGKGIRKHWRNRPGLEECFERSKVGVAEFEEAVRADERSKALAP